MAVSFDLFGTLVVADRPENPATELADALSAQGIIVPEDWQKRYWDPHLDRPAGAETPLDAHINAVLKACGISATEAQIRAAIKEVFAPTVSTVADAPAVVEWAATQGPVAVCSNCAIPGLVERTLQQSTIDQTLFDTVVSSAGCGWRKPHPTIFQTVARRLEVPVQALCHVGDTQNADSGIEQLGGEAIVLETGNIGTIPAELTNA